MFQKLEHFGHVKCSRGLERTAMKDLDPWSRDGSWHTHTGGQGFSDILDMEIHKVGKLEKD